MKSFITIGVILLLTNIILGQEFSIARVNYSISELSLFITIEK